jgi:hypothetical protein
MLSLLTPAQEEDTELPVVLPGEWLCFKNCICSLSLSPGLKGWKQEESRFCKLECSLLECRERPRGALAGQVLGKERRRGLPVGERPR